MLGWNLGLRGRADRGVSHRTAPPVRTLSGGHTPPGPPAPHPSLFTVSSRTGWWGLCEFVEPRLRRLVADGLGIEPEELAAEVSLVDDLAADSLDMLELVLAAEAEFEVTIPERTIADIRTYADLVTIVTDLIRRRRPVGADAEPTPVWTRVVPAGADTVASIERAMRLTPYAAQTIAEDARHVGRGGRLEVEVPTDTSDLDLFAVQERFARLGAHGVQVSVRRRMGLGPPPAVTTGAAASASR